MIKAFCKPVPMTAKLTLFASLAIILPTHAASGDLGSMFGGILNNKTVQEAFGLGKRNGNKTGEASSVDTVANIVGVVGLGVCSKNAAKKGGGKNGVLCAVGALAATEITKYIGISITEGLKEHEQRQVLTAATESLKSGEPAVLELPDSGVTVAINPVDGNVTKEVNLDMMMDGAAVKEFPKIFILPETKSAASTVKLYAGPNERSSKVGQLRAGERVHVIGKVDDKDWVLVSRWMQDDVAVQPIGIGFVSSKLLSASKSQDYPSEKDLIKALPQYQSVTIPAVLTCKSLNFVKTDTRGNEAKDTSFLCVGPDGQPISA